MSHFTVSHGGLNDVKRHVSESVHQQRLKDLSSSSTITTFFRKDTGDHEFKVIAAEEQRAQFIALHNISFQTATYQTLFTRIFPDSKIAADFTCKHTKAKSVCCDALDPHYKVPVLRMAKTLPFNLLCDESNDKGTAVKLLTVLVCYFDSHSGDVATQHLDTIGLCDFTVNGIFTGLESTLHKHSIPFANMLSFTSDTCSVMKGARKGVVSYLCKKQSKVLDIYCTCHLVSLCVKAAMKTLPVKVDGLLVDIFYHFYHSVKRVESLKNFANFCSTEYNSILKHCETRWLSLTQSIKHTLDM
jgi:uncharacterized membrane protein YeiH